MKRWAEQSPFVHHSQVERRYRHEHKTHHMLELKHTIKKIHRNFLVLSGNTHGTKRSPKHRSPRLSLWMKHSLAANGVERLQLFSMTEGASMFWLLYSVGISSIKMWTPYQLRQSIVIILPYCWSRHPLPIEESECLVRPYRCRTLWLCRLCWERISAFARCCSNLLECSG